MVIYRRIVATGTTARGTFLKNLLDKSFMPDEFHQLDIERPADVVKNSAHKFNRANHCLEAVRIFVEQYSELFSASPDMQGEYAKVLKSKLDGEYTIQQLIAIALLYHDIGYNQTKTIAVGSDRQDSYHATYSTEIMERDDHLKNRFHFSDTEKQYVLDLVKEHHCWIPEGLINTSDEEISWTIKDLSNRRNLFFVSLLIVMLSDVAACQGKKLNPNSVNIRTEAVRQLIKRAFSETTI